MSTFFSILLAMLVAGNIISVFCVFFLFLHRGIFYQSVYIIFPGSTFIGGKIGSATNPKNIFLKLFTEQGSKFDYLFVFD